MIALSMKKRAAKRQARQPKKIELHLLDVPDGIPNLEEITGLFRALTGREPTPEETEEARKVLEEPDEPKPRKKKTTTVPPIAVKDFEEAVSRLLKVKPPKR